MEQAEVTVDELLGGLKRRGLPLPFEIGAFIALEACEQILDRPVRLDAHDIGIGDIGEVVCATKKTAATEDSAVRSLLVLLSELLVCSAPGVPAMLLELVERGPSSGEWLLDRLRDDLEASLVPLNRGATRRVLARLVREAKKAGLERSSKPSVVPAASEIDAQFDALMALDAEPKAQAQTHARPQLRAAAAPVQSRTSASASAFAAPVSSSAPAPRQSSTPRGSFGLAAEEPAPAPVREVESSAPPHGTPSQAASLRALRTAAAVNTQDVNPGKSGSRASVRPPVEDEPILEKRPARAAAPARGERDDGRVRLQAREDGYSRGDSVRAPAMDDLLADMPHDQPSRVPMFIGAGLAVIAVALAGVYFSVGQAGARRILGLEPIAEGPLPEVQAVTRKPARAAGTLQVNSEPSRAQVFLFVGNGPATATDLPIGVAQEFVAMAEGYAPTRAVVPADAQWEEASGQPPQYELAMQATKLVSPDKAQDLGATLLPRDVGTPTGRLGSVRVITTPKGAKVYQLIGFTPDVTVENLPADAGYEVLVYLPGYGLQTRRIEPADFQDQEGRKLATIDVALGARHR